MSHTKSAYELDFIGLEDFLDTLKFHTMLYSPTAGVYALWIGDKVITYLVPLGSALSIEMACALQKSDVQAAYLRQTKMYGYDCTLYTARCVGKNKKCSPLDEDWWNKMQHERWIYPSKLIQYNECPPFSYCFIYSDSKKHPFPDGYTTITAPNKEMARALHTVVHGLDNENPRYECMMNEWELRANPKYAGSQCYDTIKFEHSVNDA